MLQAMQQSAAPASSPKSSASFAGLLAKFAEPEKKFPPARDLDSVEDDIVTLSYEHALQSQARNRPVATTAGELRPRIAETPPVSQPTAQSAPSRGSFESKTAPGTSPTLRQKNLKRASITIRLSEAESAQLHQRAAESGLTVSAYLRSCTFEVENLRAQVKETLAQLRSATSNQPQSKPAVESPRFWSRLWSRLLLRTSRAVRA